MEGTLRTKPLTYAKAAKLLEAYDEQHLHIWVPPSEDPLDLSLENECDKLCEWLADDPMRSLNGVSQPLLRLLRARILFAGGMSMAQPDDVIGHLPADLSDGQILQVLLGREIAGMRLHPEERPQ